MLAAWTQNMRTVMEDHSLRVLDLFRQYDRDDDGIITRKEFRDTMKSIKLPMSKDELKIVIHALDENHDDKINYKEFSAIFKKYTRPKPKVGKIITHTDTHRHTLTHTQTHTHTLESEKHSPHS